MSPPGRLMDEFLLIFSQSEFTIETGKAFPLKSDISDKLQLHLRKKRRNICVCENCIHYYKDNNNEGAKHLGHNVNQTDFVLTRLYKHSFHNSV